MGRRYLAWSSRWAGRPQGEDTHHDLPQVCGHSRRQTCAGTTHPFHAKGAMMRLYQGQHQAYCGVDLHARTMYLCITDPRGVVLLHEEIPASKEAFLGA